MDQKTIQTIQKVAKNLAQKYKFGYYDADDIEQEAFIIAMESLSKFDPNISSLETFLYIVISSRLKNFLRKNYVRKDIKCLYCNNTDPNCEYCQRREWMYATKKNLVEPIDIDSVNGDNEKNMSVNSDISLKMEIDEIFSIINQRLEVPLRVDYLKMLDGVYVPKQRRELIEQTILEILEEYND